MTWLAPLYLAGVLAIAAPILFHLWRRTPRGRRTFSTLMFLSPSPPRVTSLSRVEHWLLLALRAAALLLLALAFSRPVLRIPATIPVAPDELEFVAILVDTSASQQRAGQWERTNKLVTERLEQLSPGAVVGLFRFDEGWSTEFSFSESQKLDVSTRRTLVSQKLKELQPTWRGTRLGEGLVRTAQAVQEAQAGRAIPAPQRVWLVSDLQAGSDLAALREFDWPEDLPVEWLNTVDHARGNAGLQLVMSIASGAEDKLRVRVSNSASSPHQRFSLVWGDSEGSPCLEVVVPPGQSRVVALPDPPTAEAGRSLRLVGDEDDFDNRLWLPVRQPRACTVVILENSPEKESDGLRYYLERAFAANPRYDVTLVDGTQPILESSPPALVVAADVTPAAQELLPKLIAADCDVALVPSSPEAANQLAALCGWGTANFVEADVRDHVLWSEIDFESPWFAPFAEAQFSDFSGIHFWKHRQLTGDWPAKSRVLVRFDNREPAIVQWESESSRSRGWCFTSGWRPTDSQLSRSSKFVPLLWRLLEDALGDQPLSSAQSVGVPLRRPLDEQQELTVVLPDGSLAVWPEGNREFASTEQPGRYEVRSENEIQIVVVNVPPDESRTDPLPIEQLEAVRVKLSTKAERPAITSSPDQLRQQQVEELEERQQLWKWLLLAAAGLLILESWWGARSQPGVEPDPSTS